MNKLPPKLKLAEVIYKEDGETVAEIRGSSPQDTIETLNALIDYLEERENLRAAEERCEHGKNYDECIGETIKPPEAQKEKPKKDHVICRHDPEAGLCCVCSECSGHPCESSSPSDANAHKITP